MSVSTLWTHGNSLVVEDHGEYSSIRHRGWGAELTFAGPRDDEDGTNMSLRYCHIPVPTPAPVDGKVPLLVKLIVLYETSGYWQFQRIDVWDGNNPVTQIDQSYNPDVPNGTARGRGQHTTLDPVNHFMFDPAFPIATGLGVTFACQLTFLPENQPGGPNTDPEVLTVVAVGAEYLFPEPILTRFPGEVTKRRP